MISRRGVKLFVRQLMFLIHDHQTQMMKGKKKCRTGSYYDFSFGIVFKDVVPYFCPLMNRKFGMIYGYLSSQNALVIFEPFGGSTKSLARDIKPAYPLQWPEQSIQYKPLSSRTCYPLKQNHRFFLESIIDFI